MIGAISCYTLLHFVNANRNVPNKTFPINASNSRVFFLKEDLCGKLDKNVNFIFYALLAFLYCLNMRMS